MSDGLTLSNHGLQLRIKLFVFVTLIRCSFADVCSIIFIFLVTTFKGRTFNSVQSSMFAYRSRQGFDHRVLVGRSLPRRFVSCSSGQATG